jgi:hypothetical protein
MGRGRKRDQHRPERRRRRRGEERDLEVFGRAGCVPVRAGVARSGLVVPAVVVPHPALIRRAAEEGDPVDEERMRDRADRERPAGEYQRQRGGIAPSLRRRASGGAHGSDGRNYGRPGTPDSSEIFP